MVQENNLKNKILIICGPTASGKSELAVAVAKRLKSEIVCADALTVYKDLNIGTAKPSFSEMDGVVHHMINVVEPHETFSVGDYKHLAEPIVADIISRGKVPIICGGTGFYIYSILYDLSYGNSIANIEARNKYFKLAEDFGNEYVYNILKNVDPLSAEKLHFNDLKRVIRALEIYESGYLKSKLNDSMIPKYDYLAYSFDFDRKLLYEKIDKRVDKMIKLGLVDEVKTLVDKGLTEKSQSMQGIGYKEIYSFLSGKLTLEEAVSLIKLNTRHYAKRQITFFKKMQGLRYLKGDLQNNINMIVENL